jgi:mannose-6-phosphate isomerase-like protein (cupin superfamily)
MTTATTTPATATAPLVDPDAPLPEPFESSLGFRGRFVPSTDPDVLIGESWVAPGGGAGPLHLHLHQSERFVVHSGAITVRIGRRRHVVEAGGSITIPAGRPHTFVNHTDAEAHFHAYFSPPLRVEALFGELAQIDGNPGLVDAGRLMRDYREEFFYLAYVPVTLQRAVGALGRLIGRAGRR